MASKVIHQIIQVADEFPKKTAIITDNKSISYKELLSMAYYLSDWLERSKINCIGIHVRNSIEWVVIDLASLISGVSSIVLPDYFTSQQLSSILNYKCADVIITDNSEQFSRQGFVFTSCLKLLGLDILEICSQRERTNIKDNYIKITFSSTGMSDYRGVCLDEYLIDKIIESLKKRFEKMPLQKHFCMLPFSALIENILGVYVPLAGGNSIYITDLDYPDNNQNADDYSDNIREKLKQVAPDSMILRPRLLAALVDNVGKNNELPFRSKFLVMDNGIMSLTLIREARAQGWPVYSSYSLSETASLVSVNVPGMERTDSVGKPLPHLDVEIINNEICISHNHRADNLDEEPYNDGFLHTGDSGHLDEDGYLFVSETKKISGIDKQKNKINSC